MKPRAAVEKADQSLKEKVITLRVTGEYYQKIAEAAGKLGFNPTEYVRYVVANQCMLMEMQLLIGQVSEHIIRIHDQISPVDRYELALIELRAGQETGKNQDVHFTPAPIRLEPTP